ncbi:sugar ABC transporter ATP-binding protein [Candidatus Bipolaricaulota bacterium]|nr:sugar ABC transporter ATP-binding protein [Candidatus Bipolaricaulota bacterium]
MGNACEALLDVKGLTKRFPGVVALRNVDFDVREGEVHALLGENGAGKSTLIKVLGGVLQPDEGSVTFCGKRVQGIDPHRARSLGIGTIHQESELALPLSAGENIYMGRMPTSAKGIVDRREVYRNAQKWLEKVGAKFSARQAAADLSISQRRLVELARAVSMDAKLLIMDEPTTVFTDEEVETLFRIIRELKQQGVATIYISHRLQEIYEIADRVTVLRDGEKMGTLDAGDAGEDTLIKMMVGRQLSQVYPERDGADPSSELLRVEDLTRRGVIEAVSFTVNAGEIVGLSGLVGAGRTSVANILFGAMKADRGEVWLRGKKIRIHSPASAIRNGIGYITADRKLDGLLLIKSIRENVSLACLRQLQRFSFIARGRERQVAEKFKNVLAIKTPSIDQIVENLSGGNQQKVVFARWMLAKSDLLILDEPTVGIDVGAKQEIYRLMNGIAAEGRGILMISSELPELLGMCDRILVMREGRIVHEVSRDEATQEKILYYSAGFHETSRGSSEGASECGRI